MLRLNSKTLGTIYEGWLESSLLYSGTCMSFSLPNDVSYTYVLHTCAYIYICACVYIERKILNYHHVGRRENKTVCLPSRTNTHDDQNRHPNCRKKSLHEIAKDFEMYFFKIFFKISLYPINSNKII